MKSSNQKLYVITRRDLTAGQQMLQSAHAAIEFQHEHSEIAKEWNTQSKYLIFLSVENENELQKLLYKIQFYDLKYTTFLEPDIGNQLTAICIEPSERTQKLTSNLPLALK
jgi:peptidyl-tRNA hydrolase